MQYKINFHWDEHMLQICQYSWKKFGGVIKK